MQLIRLFRDKHRFIKKLLVIRDVVQFTRDSKASDKIRVLCREDIHDKTEIVGNGFCCSLVEHWSSNPEDAHLLCQSSTNVYRSTGVL